MKLPPYCLHNIHRCITWNQHIFLYRTVDGRDELDASFGPALVIKVIQLLHHSIVVEGHLLSGFAVAWLVEHGWRVLHQHNQNLVEHCIPYLFLKTAPMIYNDVLHNLDKTPSDLWPVLLCNARHFSKHVLPNLGYVYLLLCGGDVTLSCFSEVWSLRWLS